VQSRSILERNERVSHLVIGAHAAARAGRSHQSRAGCRIYSGDGPFGSWPVWRHQSLKVAGRCAALLASAADMWRASAFLSTAAEKPAPQPEQWEPLSRRGELESDLSYLVPFDLAHDELGLAEP